MGSNYVQEREAICRNPPDTLGRKRLAGSRCHSQVVTKAMHGVKGHSWYWEVGYARNTDKRGKRRRRESEEGEGYEDAMRRISLLLTNSNKQRTSLHVKNAKK